MQQSLALFLPQVVEPRRQQTELNRVEEIGLAGAVPPDEGVMTRSEGLDAVLLAEGPEAAYFYRLDRERRHLNLRRFVKLAALSLRRGGVAHQPAAPRRGLRQRRANPARGNLPARPSRSARGALFALRASADD